MLMDRVQDSYATCHRRADIERHIQSLIDLLDEIDAPSEDLEDIDEPSLGAAELCYVSSRYPESTRWRTGPQLRWGDGGTSDLEADDSDLEPSLASPEDVFASRSQEGWARGGWHDFEDEHDGCEPDEDGEASLGWTNDRQELGCSGSFGELEPSLGSVEAVDQTAWGLSGTDDLEQVGRLKGGVA